MSWPEKRQLLAVDLSITDYAFAVAAICHAAKARKGCAVAALSIHGIVLATAEPGFAESLQALDLATPDGQGSRWALNWLHHTGLRDRVYGPELTLRVAEEAARQDISLYLYGSTSDVSARLRDVLISRFAGLRIVGVHSPPFRPCTPDEESADLLAIRDSGAQIVLVGLGCPRQEEWVVKHRAQTCAVLIAVGAAYDFLTGNKPQAPAWMQKCGLEMVFRVLMEPRRLWRRLVFYSIPFVFLVALQKFRVVTFLPKGEIKFLGWTLRSRVRDRLAA